MCIYTRFKYLCLHEKVKIKRPCNRAVKDSQGVLTCPDTPNVEDVYGVWQNHAERTYGVGICSNIHCAWNHGILPYGDYGNDRKFGDSTSFEDDTEIDDSLAAREERVGRWFQLLSADQQLDHFKTEYPIPDHERSADGRAILNFPHDMISVWDTLRWQELNPLYLTPAMLQWCVRSRLLPASIADGRRSKTISPHKPLFGPFKPKDTHKCPKKHGICKTCGENIGKKKLKDATLAYQQNVALSNLLNEELSDEKLSEDPRGSALDPNVELKWDDEKGEYRKVPASIPASFYDAPYPESSNPAFVPSMTQAVDTAAVFRGQEGLLADNGAHASTAMDLAAGMDWGAFVQGTTLDGHADASHGSSHWPASDFNSTTHLPAMPQAEPNHFSFAADSPFAAGLDTAASADTGNQPYFDLGLPENNFESFEPIEELSNFATTSSHDPLFSNFDTSFQTPQAVSSDFFDDPMITCDSGGDTFTSDDQTAGLFNEQSMTEMMDGHSPETVGLVHQMLRQAFNGVVVCPSYDPAANALFEQVMQYKGAGLV